MQAWIVRLLYNSNINVNKKHLAATLKIIIFYLFYLETCYKNMNMNWMVRDMSA